MDNLYAGKYQPLYDSSWALVIGINDYEHAVPLSNARKDAEDVALALQEIGFAQNCIELITDRDASRARIVSQFLRYVELAASPDDRVIVFFAGHGVTMPGYRGEVGYLVPADGDPIGLASLIRWDELTRNADLIAAKHILFILDACFSGLACKRVIQPGVNRFVSDMLQRRARQVIAAGKADEVVADQGGPGGQNSIFTAHLLRGLRGAAATSGGVITASTLMNYVYQKVAEDPLAEQTPHGGHIDGDGDLVLVSGGEASSSIGQADAIVETAPPIPETPLVPEHVAPPATFVEATGYAAPASPQFGRNQFSDRLGSVDRANGLQEVKAFSWLAVVVEPVADAALAINIAAEAKRLSELSAQGAEPFERFLPPREPMTTIDSVVLFDKLRYGSDYWARYLRIEKAGNIEFCDSLYSFFSHRDTRAFRYVQVVGLVWQFLFFAKRILAERRYERGARVLVNLVGTRDTILADFADAPGQGGQRWREPGRPDPLDVGGSLLELKCPDPNLQMNYRLVLGELDEAASRQVIDDVAKQLALAYNHQSEPRCFNYGTDVFPWNSFFRARQMLS
jgi:hypothetical protein